MLTDSHCHLDSPKLRAELPAVLARARDAGVTRVLTVSSEVGDYERVVDVAAEAAAHLDGAWAAVGVHPHEASRWDDSHRERIRRACRSPAVVAVGEIGLDYHYDHSPREAQAGAFRDQLRLARELGLPVVIHSREAEADTAAILREESRGAALPGVLHCFTSRPELADAALELGMCVSFSGIVTFPSAAELVRTARAVPAERLLVETDAPFLAPVPHRGRRCEPAFVRHTAEFVAAARGVPLASLAASSNAAFDALFLQPPRR